MSISGIIEDFLAVNRREFDGQPPTCEVVAVVVENQQSKKATRN
jgi:hypothetical protein